MTSDDVIPDHQDPDGALLDSVYQRMRGTGPEFEGWPSNHGPMAADALMRMGRAEVVEPWLGDYVLELDDAPRPRWEIEESDWREVLGDPSRLGDWLAFFDRRVREEPWRDLLARWWPRLVPGSVAAATHGLIRTGHAVRAVAEDPNPRRLAELAQGLGYWAARWRPAPRPAMPRGSHSLGDALAGLPRIDERAGFNTSAHLVSELPGWAPAVRALAPPTDPSAVTRALDDLVDATVDLYRSWAHESPVMVVHASTAPRAAALVVPHLPADLRIPTYAHAWAASATIVSAYRSRELRSDPVPVANVPLDVEGVIDRVVDTADAHAIKFAEVAVESHRRGRPERWRPPTRRRRSSAPEDRAPRPHRGEAAEAAARGHQVRARRARRRRTRVRIGGRPGLEAASSSGFAGGPRRQRSRDGAMAIRGDRRRADLVLHRRRPANRVGD